MVVEPANLIEIKIVTYNRPANLALIPKRAMESYLMSALGATHRTDSLHTKGTPQVPIRVSM